MAAERHVIYADRIRKKKRRRRILSVAVFCVLCLAAAAAVLCLRGRSAPYYDASAPGAIDFVIPRYSGSPGTEINGNIPFFAESDLTVTAYEHYSPLDRLGRCGPATACLGPETMPTRERGQIGTIRPSGWHTVRYDDLIEDRYLYNRCHLIAYMLAGENDNELNLITGTRYFNTVGMLPYEILTADFIRQSGYHVLYRVTPVFEGGDLVARGVLIEALSVEDRGAGLCFNAFVFNVQPGIVIDYRTGESQRAEVP